MPSWTSAFDVNTLCSQEVNTKVYRYKVAQLPLALAVYHGGTARAFAPAGFTGIAGVPGGAWCSRDHFKIPSKSLHTFFVLKSGQGWSMPSIQCVATKPTSAWHMTNCLRISMQWSSDSSFSQLAPLIDTAYRQVEEIKQYIPMWVRIESLWLPLKSKVTFW